jgi:3-phosphoshikimate 1-carboxyvinyltransferase
MKVRPAQRIAGKVTLSGDKSISHRAAIIAAVARGVSKITNFSASQDCASTLDCLRDLGVSVTAEESGLWVVGQGLDGFTRPLKSLDCGNSGSTMRMLSGLLAGQSFASELTGDPSLASRPMRRIIEPLEMMGAQVESRDGKPPLRISRSKPLCSIHYELPVASAQVKSCVLLAGLNADGRTSVVERVRTRDHTERMLSWYKAPIDVTDRSNGSAEISIAGEIPFGGRDVCIPGDISSAAFMVAAAALLPGSTLMVQDVSLNRTRTQFLSELESLGAEISFEDVRDICNEPVGNLCVKGGLNPASEEMGLKRLSGDLIPQLIDELPLLAVVGSQLAGGLEIRDAGELRVKESDRLSTTVRNLQAMGAEVEEYPDGLAVAGQTQLRGTTLDSHGDHRIAMAFAVAALTAEGESEIKGAQCVAVSFPDFFDLLESLAVR